VGLKQCPFTKPDYQSQLMFDHQIKAVLKLYLFILYLCNKIAMHSL